MLNFKKLICMLSILLFLFIPCFSMATLRTITVTWAQEGKGIVEGYKMYYSYSSDMSNQILACETNSQAATSLICADVNLVASPIYFVIAIKTPEEEVNSGIVMKYYINKVQDFKSGSRVL